MRSRVRLSRLAFIVAAGALLPVRDAAAQLTARPPVEAGAAIGGVLGVPYEDFFSSDELASPSADLRITVPFTPRFAIEGLVTIGRRDQQFTRRTEGLYAFTIKQRLRRGTRGRFHPFLSYGIAGYHAHVKQDAVRFVDDAGREHVSPAFEYREVDEPIAALVGGGVHHVVASRLAVRAEAQLLSVLWIPLGVRLSGGISIPFGSYD